jgi:ribosomal-protein-alanine N-acetyltransferase
MEKMPYQTHLTVETAMASPEQVVHSDWQKQLPVLRGKRVIVRELRASDAVSLHALLTTEEVSRFISPPPATVQEFEKFIAWTHRQRAAGAYVCYAVTLEGFDTAIGIFQVRQLDPSFGTAEWGFAFGSAFWGTGIFQESAELVMEFGFEVLGINRLEARAAVANGRGNGALLKLGAVQECVLRKSFVRDGVASDQALYAMLQDDWRALRSSSQNNVSSVRVH